MSKRWNVTTPVLWALLLVAAPARAQTKVAFLGDQGLGADSVAVLQMIEDEGAEAVMHPGDLDYADNPAAFWNQVNSVLGSTFPYFITCGNHDESQWYAANGYQDRFEARMSALGIPWSGDLGVKSTFVWRGIRFVLTAPGSFGSNHNVYIRDRFAADPTSLWRISTWHKNQTLMQVGTKGNETGWGVYEESRKAGAIIITAHEHSYCRSHLLSDCDNPTIASTSNTLELEADDPATTADEGRTFVVVSGLAGESIRDQQRDDPWWASIYASDQGADYGAMFCTFGDAGPRHASCYFKAINDDIPDAYFVRTPHGVAVAECNDDFDNDADGDVDFPADAQCWSPTDPVEGEGGCGLGVELVLLLPLLARLRR